MNFRLQNLIATTNIQVENGVDLTFWQAATTLQYCGVELRVHTGAVTVSLRLLCDGGDSIEIARLVAPFPGARFSPPLQLAELTPQGTTLVAVLCSASDDAEYELYLGSNDHPETYQASVALLARATNTQVALRTLECFAQFHQKYIRCGTALRCQLMLDLPRPDSVLEQHLAARPELHRFCHLLSGRAGTSLRRAAYQLAYGPISASHFAVLPSDAMLSEELFVNSAGLVPFLSRNAALHTPASSEAQVSTLPQTCFDLHQILRFGLPRSALNTYMLRLKHRGIQRFNPHCAAPDLPAVSRLERLQQGLRALTPRAPNSQQMALYQKQSAALSALRQDNSCQIRQMQDRLKHNHLWASDQIRADLNRTNQAVLSLLRNRHIGARAVVIGNGPSLRLSDLDRLKQEVTFASNKIYLSYEDTDWRPTYYSVEDHLVLLNNLEKIRELSGSLKLFPANTRDFDYHASDTIFAPFLPPQSFDDPLSDPDFPAFSHDLSQGIAWGSTITYSQIQMAAFMGCSEIILIGVDHSYQLPSKKMGNQYIHEGEQNHFHPDYRKPGEAWHQPNLEVIERSYTKARDICAAQGVRILNASRQTQLDVFERVDFDQLFPAPGSPQ